MIPLEEALVLIRKSDILTEWTDEQILAEITLAANTGALVYTTTSEGKLKSICFGHWHGKCYHCSALIAHGEVDLFIKHLKKTYPLCEALSFNRKGKFKVFNLK